MEIRSSANKNSLVNENIYKTLVEELPLPVALYIGPEMRVSHVNQSLLQVWGKGEDVIGKTFREALPELEGQPYYDILDNVFATGIPYQATEDRVDLFIDGRMQTFYFNFTYKPLKDEEGKVWGILNTATDVTELIVTRKKLEEAKENTQLALKAAQLGTWSMDPITYQITLDERTKLLFNFDKNGTAYYFQLLNYVHEADREKVKKAVSKALEPESKGTYNISFRTSPEHGEVRFLRCNGKVYFNEDRAPYRFAGTTLDITEDVLAQKELTRFLALIENSDDLIGLTDLQGNVVYLNKAGKNLVGADESNFQRPSNDFLVPEDLERLQPEMTASMEKKGRFSGEIRYKHLQTGEQIPCYINAFIITDPETNEPLAMASVTRDLRSEKATQKEQQKLITLVENSKDLMSILEFNGINSYLNKAGKELLGFENDEEVKSTPITQLHTPEDLEFVQSEVLPALQTKGSWAGVMNVRNKKTGEVFPVHNSTIRIDDPVTGEPLCIGALMRDLRPELAAKQVLAEREKLFRDITTAAPAALWMTDINKQLTYINQIWLDWTQMPLEAQLGFGWSQLIAEEDKKRIIEEFSEDFDQRRHHECVFRLKSPGTERWIICSGNPQYTNEGSFIGYIGTCVDITELKQLQQQKDEFLGIASHELKTPVTSIKAYAQVLESMFRDSGDNRKADMVKKMDLQVNRLTNLIQDLLDVTKIHTGKLLFNDREFVFNDLVKELIEDLQRTTKKHVIIPQLADTGVVFADRERIGQVITNLITNAIKYSPNADKIIVSTSLLNEEIRLCVQDFGIGIPGDKTEKVFEQFYRVSGEKQHTFPGLGLGLYISSEIIKREDGRIWVNSEEGKGSTFCFSLPVNRQHN